MSSALGLALSGLAGVVLGLLFYGGLWLTLDRLTATRSPALLVLTSFLVRTLLAVAGFLLLSGGRWERLLACLAGFIVARLALVKALGPATDRAGKVSVDDYHS
ncbi:MAG: ATP synthase subunit I [Anaerolineae bacterium]|nr:ATP synthase subunit I [Anaerolineae bacterium]